MTIPQNSKLHKNNPDEIHGGLSLIQGKTAYFVMSDHVM